MCNKASKPCSGAAGTGLFSFLGIEFKRRLVPKETKSMRSPSIMYGARLPPKLKS